AFLAHAPRGRWDRTLVVTHFAPSLKSADPRYGAQPGTASFCSADDDLIPRADLWLHGHLHCRHDYRVPRPGRAPGRVVCNARGLATKGEDQGHLPLLVLDI
ncbi:MAG: phosphoesterase, partial [Rubrivivax sp.]|nr:phosphoesterase [Rubrivivax sp.]